MPSPHLTTWAQEVYVKCLSHEQRHSIPSDSSDELIRILLGVIKNIPNHRGISPYCPTNNHISFSLPSRYPTQKKEQLHSALEGFERSQESLCRFVWGNFAITREEQQYPPTFALSLNCKVERQLEIKNYVLKTQQNIRGTVCTEKQLQ